MAAEGLRGGWRSLLSNSSLLTLSSLLISLTGSVYWWLAARTFPADVIGQASVALTAMQLLGTLGTLGLGTLLVDELQRRAAAPLLGSALCLAALLSGLLGAIVALLAPILPGPAAAAAEPR